MKKAFGTLMVTLILLSGGADAYGNEKGKWSFNLAPLYLWGISLEGDADLGSDSGDFPVDLGNPFNSLEAAFTLRFDAYHKSHWGLGFDLIYANISGTDEDAVPEYNIDLKALIATLEGYYRFTLNPRHSLDAKLGVRYAGLDLELDFNRVQKGIDQSANLVDPIVGLRWNWMLTDKWRTRVIGDIGGLGNSDFTWQAGGFIDFQPWRYVSLALGYRALGYKFDVGSGSDAFSYDALIHGPILGLNIRW